MLFKKWDIPKRDLFLIRCWLQITAGFILVIISVFILKRALLCLCPQQFLLLIGSFISGAGLIIYSIHLIREDRRLQKLSDEIG